MEKNEKYLKVDESIQIVSSVYKQRMNKMNEALNWNQA